MIMLHAFVALAIAVRIMTFQRRSITFSPLEGVVAWALVCTSGYTFLSVVYGRYTTFNLSEFVFNVFILIVLLHSKGDVWFMWRRRRATDNA